jgi:hypothetical protein
VLLFKDRYKKDKKLMPRTLEEINKNTVDVLCKEAADLWEKYHVPFIVNGLEIQRRSQITGRSKVKKEHVAEYISMVEGMLASGELGKKSQKIKPQVEEIKPVEVVETVEPANTVEVVEPVKQPTVVVTIDEEFNYSKSEDEKRDIAKRLYYSTEAKDGFTGLREYQFNLCKTQKYFLPEFAILVARTRVIIEDYANTKSLEGKAHPGSIQKIRVDVMKYLAEIIKPEVDKFPAVNDRTLQDIFDDFDKSVRGAFSDIGAAKHRLNKERAEAREEDVRAVKAYPLINWAVETVNNLPDKDISQMRKLSAKWKEVAIAVMLLTGRRQSEVMSSGVFTLVDESTIIFEGQLKRHVAELVAPEKIPVLGKAAKGVIDAVQWLEFYGKRTLPEAREVDAIQKAAKLSHDRCSRYIAETMETLAELCPIQNNKQWETAENGKLINKFKGHLTRQIYAQICDGLFHNKHESKKRAFISRILLENRDAALSYDRDIEIVDMEELRDLCGSLADD